MNVIRLLMFGLLVVSGGVCKAGEKWLEDRVNEPLFITRTRALAEEMAKHNSKLEKMKPLLCSESQSFLEKSRLIAANVLFFPPLGQLLWKKQNPLWKIGVLTPGVVPLYGRFLIAGVDIQLYDSYIRRQVQLVNFRNKVEYFKKWLMCQAPSVTIARAYSMALDFSDKDYDNINEYFVDEVCKIIYREHIKEKRNLKRERAQEGKQFEGKMIGTTSDSR